MFGHSNRHQPDEAMVKIVESFNINEFQILMNDVMKDMGFWISNSQVRSNHDIVINAQPSLLSWGIPRLLVKIRNDKLLIDIDELQDFSSMIHWDEIGWFISTGGFSDDALIEIRKSKRLITLLDKYAITAIALTHLNALDQRIKIKFPPYKT